MDPLSAAASGIAVVSLTIQLVDSVRQIQRFLRNVSEAPKELRRLIDLLEQLELILASIGDLIDRQQRQSETQDVAVSETVLRAMKNCESTIQGLASVVDRERKSVEAKNKATKTLGSFRLSYKKKDIERFEHQLHEAISLLNLTMTTNLTALHSKSVGNLLTQVMATNQITTTISQELVLLRNGSAGGCSQSCHGVVARAGASTSSSENLTRSRASHNQSTMSSFNTLFGRVVIKKGSSAVTVDNGKGGLSTCDFARDESTWMLMPTFFASCINFRYIKSCDHVQRSLRVYPVIRRDHPVWYMCWSGDVAGIQKLFSERQVSPFSVDPWGRTLLQYSAFAYRWKICKFLFQVGYTNHDLDICQNDPIIFTSVCTEERVDALESTYNLMVSRIDDPDPFYFAIAFFDRSNNLEPGIHLYRKMVNLLIRKESVNALFSRYKVSPILMALRMLWKCNPTAHGPWKEAIQHVLGLGVDIHTTFNYRAPGHVTTLLDTVLNMADQSFESHWIGQQWLAILSQSGIDIDEYLRVESELHCNPSQTMPMISRDVYTGYRDSYLIISKESANVSWEWYINPGGRAFDVLQEFKDFGTEYQNSAHANYSKDWPFFYPDWRRIAHRIWSGLGILNDEESCLRTFNNRCERREEKKATKLARAQGLLRRGPKIPGSWID